MEDIRVKLKKIHMNINLNFEIQSTYNTKQIYQHTCVCVMYTTKYDDTIMPYR